MLQNTSQGHKAQANPTFDSSKKYNSPNYKSTTSNDRHTKSGLQPPPTFVNTPQPPCHRHSPCPLTNSLPHATPYTISHHPSDYRSTVPSSPTTQCYPLYNQLILYSYSSLHPPQTSALAPQTHYPSFSSIVIPPQSHTSIPRMGNSEQDKAAQQRMTKIFFYGKRCTMYNNN